ncbi:methyltransferase [Candidatus Micrarchaeota archaeon]|nr:methyltransferase [Candidatus Micrarchaeota archaeon]
MQVKEYRTVVDTGSLFYNPHMELNRDISSLAVGALSLYDERFSSLSVCDGMSASGIRGLRYAMENPNVEHVTLVDANRRALPVMKSNIERNGLTERVTAVCDNIIRHLAERSYTFIELDPFGTPQPFIRPAVSSFSSNNRIKRAVLSVTATDTAVLCGAHYKACMKLYHARPLNEFACHEIGARILLANIAWAASEYDFGVKPLLTFSHRHYFKLFVILERGARHAYNNIKQIGFVSYRPRDMGFVVSEYPDLSHRPVQVAGPMWIGSIHDATFIRMMVRLNDERRYKNFKVISKILELMRDESDGPILYYDIHKVAKKLGTSSPRLSDTINLLKESGYKATRTHFNLRGIKTDANLYAFLKSQQRS